MSQIRRTAQSSNDNISSPYDHFERQYSKEFSRNHLFSTDLVGRIHKRVQMFLHSYNMKYLDDVQKRTL